MNRLVYQVVRELGGSISAEHGLMNPGKVLAPTTINQYEAKRRHTWQLNLK